MFQPDTGCIFDSICWIICFRRWNWQYQFDLPAAPEIDSIFEYPTSGGSIQPFERGHHAMIDYEFKTGQVFIKMESLEPLHDQIKISMSLFRLYLTSGSFNPWKIPLWSSWAFLVKRVLIRRTLAIFGFLSAAGVIATVALGDNSTFAPHPSHPLTSSLLVPWLNGILNHPSCSLLLLTLHPSNGQG